MVHTNFLRNILFCAFSALVLASSSPCWERTMLPDLFSFCVFGGSCFALLLDLLLVTSGVLGREAACGANATIGWTPLDGLDSFMRLRACTLFVHTTFIVINVVFFRETGRPR